MPKLEPKNAEQRKWLKDRNKYCSGFCNNYNKAAQCEGTKPKGWNGEPMKTCEFYLTCPCECHYRIDEMFKATGMERQLMPNPEYVPQRTEFVMPEQHVDDPLGPAVTSGVSLDPNDDELAVAVTPAPAAAPLAHRRTDTGRAARGGLEAQVWDACFNMPGDDDLTPKQVVEWIAEKYKIPTPSTGAVNAVWDRWVKLGFCEIGKKPNRFLGFQNDGTWEELARIKGAANRQAKSAKIATKLGRR